MTPMRRESARLVHVFRWLSSSRSQNGERGEDRIAARCGSQQRSRRAGRGLRRSSSLIVLALGKGVVVPTTAFPFWTCPRTFVRFVVWADYFLDVTVIIVRTRGNDDDERHNCFRMQNPRIPFVACSLACSHACVVPCPGLRFWIQKRATLQLLYNHHHHHPHPHTHAHTILLNLCTAAQSARERQEAGSRRGIS